MSKNRTQEMDEVGYSIKQLFFMNYRNKSEKAISVFDFLTLYRQNNYQLLEFFKIDFINIPGVMVIDLKGAKLYLPVGNNKLDTITINNHEANEIEYTYRSIDKFLELAVNSSESNVLKKIFINICDCPSDMQEDLIKYRQKILDEQLARKNRMLRKNKYNLMRKRSLERRKMTW